MNSDSHNYDFEITNEVIEKTHTHTLSKKTNNPTHIVINHNHSINVIYSGR